MKSGVFITKDVRFEIVVVHALPELARTGAIGADGIAIADLRTAQIAILNEEKQ